MTCLTIPCEVIACPRAARPDSRGLCGHCCADLGGSELTPEWLDRRSEVVRGHNATSVGRAKAKRTKRPPRQNPEPNPAPSDWRRLLLELELERSGLRPDQLADTEEDPLEDLPESTDADRVLAREINRDFALLALRETT
jgi:hypothetical protein